MRELQFDAQMCGGVKRSVNKLPARFLHSRLGIHLPLLQKTRRLPRERSVF